jgi:hypothetical protein
MLPVEGVQGVMIWPPLRSLLVSASNDNGAVATFLRLTKPENDVYCEGIMDTGKIKQRNAAQAVFTGAAVVYARIHTACPCFYFYDLH